MDIIDHIIDRRKHIVMAFQKQMVDDHLTIDQTSAGQLKREDIIKGKEKAARGLRENQEELEASLRKKEEQKVRQLREEQTEYERKIKQKDEDIKALKMSVAVLQKQKEAQIEREQELQRFMEEQDAKIAVMSDELASLQAMQAENSALLHENKIRQHGDAGQGNKAFVERLTSNVYETNDRMEMLSERMDEIESERRTTKEQEKRDIREAEHAQHVGSQRTVVSAHITNTIKAGPLTLRVLLQDGPAE
ncbi:MAG: hypothetical protein Q9216_002621 [Gyalolechia sp. 2 TL-2023]